MGRGIEFLFSNFSEFLVYCGFCTFLITVGALIYYKRWIREEIEKERIENEVKNKDDAQEHFELATNNILQDSGDSAIKECQILQQSNNELENELYDKILCEDKIRYLKKIVKKRPHIIPSITAVFILLGALGSWQYGYYQLLRIVVCVVSAYIAFISGERDRKWLVWIFGIIAVLFNPIIPMELTRETWQIIDVISALIFFIIAFIPINEYKNSKYDMVVSEQIRNSKNIVSPIKSSALQTFQKQEELDLNKETIHDSLLPYDCDIGDYDQTIYKQTKIIELNPGSPIIGRSYFLRGTAYYKKRQYDLAIKDYTNAIKYDTMFIDWLMQPGHIHYDSETQHQIELNPETEEALRFDVIKDINQYQRFPFDYYYRANAYYEKGEYGLAISDFFKVIEVQPNTSLGKSSHYYCGCIYLKLEEKDSAMEQYQILEKLDKELAEELYEKIFSGCI